MSNKVTREQIQDLIVGAQFHVFQDTTVTVCCLELRNGFSAIGYSACVDPADFDADIGKSMAYDDAFDKIWQLEGYARCNQMSQAEAHELDE